MMNKQIKNALKKNSEWFLNSGVMNPSNGHWGIAERILLTSNNISSEKALRKFPAWTHFKGGCVLEQRRSDCNFQTAHYFLLLHSITGEEKYYCIADKLLNYLYNLSGMLSRNKKTTTFPTGIWNWSNIRWTPALWFDDNSWCIILAFMIAECQPELEKKYQMKKYAYAGAKALADSFEQYYFNNEPCWSGDVKLPHWGAMVMAALATAAYKNEDNAILWQGWAEKYFDDIISRINELNISEYAYSLLGLSFAAMVYDEDSNKQFIFQGKKIANLLLDKMNPQSGCLPSTHFEAPKGEKLLDLIYTQNWALLALQCFNAINPDPNYQNAIRLIVKLILKIQDTTLDERFYGCWRGMYDLEQNSWGGGDLYEGGASSIYTGWTNAPLGWVLIYQLKNSSLVEIL